VRIRTEDIIAGYPARRVRALVRKWGRGASSPALLVQELGITMREARTVMTALQREHFVSRLEPRGGERGEWFELTVKGRALAAATAAKPLRRATVERKLVELVDRLARVNEATEFLVGIERAYVYGSYLSASVYLGDLDISLTFYRKEPNGERFIELSRRAAEESGRRFNTYIDELYWPERHVLLFLTQRSRVFSLHVDEPLLKDASVPRRPIFRRHRPCAWLRPAT
jgi:hypothetical protein